MAKKFLKQLPYLIVLILTFYLLPTIIKDTGSAIFILIVFMPILCFINGLINGNFNSFSLLYPLAIAVLFFGSVYIFYNSTALIYVVTFALIGAIGNVIGALIRRSRLKRMAKTTE